MDIEYWQLAFSKHVTKYTSVCLEAEIYTAKQRHLNPQNSTGKFSSQKKRESCLT